MRKKQPNKFLIALLVGVVSAIIDIVLAQILFTPLVYTLELDYFPLLIINTLKTGVILCGCSLIGFKLIAGLDVNIALIVIIPLAAGVINYVMPSLITVFIILSGLSVSRTFLIVLDIGFPFTVSLVCSLITGAFAKPKPELS